MAGFEHGMVHPKEEEDMVLAARNANYGMILFLLYFVVYGGFVSLSAFWPEVMASEAFLGVNVAIIYGFSLIILALILALLYSWLCRKKADIG